MERLPDHPLFGPAFRDAQTGKVWHIDVDDEAGTLFDEAMAARHVRAVTDARRLWKAARWVGRSYGEGDITLEAARRRCETLAHRPDPAFDDVPGVNILPDWFAERLAGRAFLEGRRSVGGR